VGVFSGRGGFIFVEKWDLLVTWHFVWVGGVGVVFFWGGGTFDIEMKSGITQLW